MATETATELTPIEHLRSGLDSLEKAIAALSDLEQYERADYVRSCAHAVSDMIEHLQPSGFDGYLSIEDAQDVISKVLCTHCPSCGCVLAEPCACNHECPLHT